MRCTNVVVFIWLIIITAAIALETAHIEKRKRRKKNYRTHFQLYFRFFFFFVLPLSLSLSDAFSLSLALLFVRSLTTTTAREIVCVICRLTMPLAILEKKFFFVWGRRCLLVCVCGQTMEKNSFKVKMQGIDTLSLVWQLETDCCRCWTVAIVMTTTLIKVHCTTTN